MSDNSLQAFVRAARRRRWLQAMVRRMAIGASAGSLAAGILWLLSLRFAFLGSAEQLFLIAAVGLLGGAAAGLAARGSLKEAAMAIDERAQLKDRVHSALQFAPQAAGNDYCRLQVADAERSLREQALTELFPWRWPREGTWALASGLFAAAVILFTPGPSPVQATVHEPPLAVRAEAAELQAQLDEWKQLSEEFNSDEMRELTRKLQKMLAEMKDKSESVEKAMVQLARMTSEVDAAAAQFNPLVLQQALQDLAQGMKGLDGFEQIAANLKAEDYDSAAQAAQQFGEGIGAGAKPMPSSGGLVESRLGQLGEQAQSAGLSDLSDALKSLQKAVQQGSRGNCESSLKKLGSSVRKYGNRLKIGRSMRSQLNSLNECKQCLANSYCKNCMGNKPCSGGNCKGAGFKLGLPNLTAAQSKSPSLGAGTAASMNKFGAETSLRANRRQEHVEGQLGEGESESEVEVSPEGQQTAATMYRQVYAKYQKLSDSVIAEEAIPLAHRQTIKRYFELIHPDRVDPETQLKDVRLDVARPVGTGDRKEGGQ